MIIDAHTHAWERWPYGGDTGQVGDAEALIREMDDAGVDRALVVCAAIGGTQGPAANPHNNAYVAEAAGRYPGRLEVIVDVDSHWSASHHTPGSPQRLAAAHEATGAVGVTHYLQDTPDDWFRAGEGPAFLAAVQSRRLFLSLHARPAWFSQVADALRRVPELPVLIHHQGHLQPNSRFYADELSQLADLARLPGVFVKVSGHHYLGDVEGEYPFSSTHRVLLDLLELFGAERLLWGSDFPVSRRHMTYRQSLEILEHFALDADQRAMILGGSAQRVLEWVRP